MILKKSYLKKLLALTLALSLSLSTVAQASFNSNAGSGDSSAASSSSPVSGSTYDDANQGIRFYIVDTTGTIIGNVVDITYNNPYNYMELGNSAGQYLDTTKFGDFELTNYNDDYVGQYSAFFPSYTLSDGTTMSAMPLPVDYISSSNIQVYGDTIREYFMGTREDTGEANLKAFVNDKGGEDTDGDGIADGDIFGLQDHYGSTENPSQLICDNELRIMAEPLMWYHPHNWDTTNNCLCTYSNIDYWVYGTPTGIGQHLVSKGITGSGGYATITHLYEPISMILMNNLTVGSQTIETTSEAGVPESGYRYTGTELASTTVGHALHSYSAEDLGETSSQTYIAYYFSVLNDQTVEEYEASLSHMSSDDLTEGSERLLDAWNSVSSSELVYPYATNESPVANDEYYGSVITEELIYTAEYEGVFYNLYALDSTGEILLSTGDTNSEWQEAPTSF